VAGDGGGGHQDRVRRHRANPTSPGGFSTPGYYASGLSRAVFMINRISRFVGRLERLIAAAAFFIIELLAPGAFMLWLGLSALSSASSRFRHMAVAVSACRPRGVRAGFDRQRQIVSSIFRARCLAKADPAFSQPAKSTANSR